MSRWLRALAALLLLTAAVTAFAIDSQPPFPDAAEQARYETLIHVFRCLVCQNETIADSDADLAADLRRQVHDMVAAGRSDTEIRAYLVDRYGNFVLYKPPVETSTWLLWSGPFLLLFVGLVVVITVVRRRAHMDAAPPAGEA
jgi:cytochrome c-type biogenesis protein CcmH